MAISISSPLQKSGVSVPYVLSEYLKGGFRVTASIKPHLNIGD